MPPTGRVRGAAEELDLEKPFRQGVAGHNDACPGRSLPLLVQGTRDEGFATTRLTKNEREALADGGVEHLGAQAVHGPARPYKHGEGLDQQFGRELWCPDGSGAELDHADGVTGVQTDRQFCTS